MTEVAERRAKKLRKKTDHRGYELAIARTEFALDKKASSQGMIFFEGYASIFNTADSYNDIIKPGAFKNTLKKKGPRKVKGTEEIDSDIISLWQHNPDWPFGLPHHMEEDSTGLYHRTMVSDTTENMDRIKYMEDRVVKGESIGFMTVKSEWDEDDVDEDEIWPIRYIKEIDLWEISPVTFPAHSDAVTTLIQRNRELALAVKKTDHGSILQTAYKLKGISAPMVEQAIAVLTSVKEALPEETPDDIDDEDLPTDEVVTEDPPEDDNPDTSEEDPVLIEALEEFSLQLDLEAIADQL